MTTVAALCVSGRSIYKHLPGVEAYDVIRDARTFRGMSPVIAHPPCRCWSRFTAHQAKPVDEQREKQLGAWCALQVIRWGGILEQPAHSGLFAALELPQPGDFTDPLLYTVKVEQGLFGYATLKPTWLLIAGVPWRRIPPLPATVRPQFKIDGTALSKQARSRTTQPLAQWLLSIARESWWTACNQTLPG
jgi:hypothetical protein